jgi:uncharacterized protein YjeT (DUF2065 family)
MWSFVDDVPSGVQMVMLISAVLMGVSHIVQPKLWVEFFTKLAERGNVGMVANQLLNTTAGSFIVALHQVWTGPAIVLTLYGWALVLKSVIGLWTPVGGMRMLRMARHGDNAFRIAGAALLGVGLCCALALAGVGMPA